MELYELTLHFPNSYGSLENEDLTLKSTDYYDSEEKAIARAKVVASSFVTPKPDFYYLEDGTGRVIWTDYPEQTKKAIHYDLIADKPIIKTLTNND